MVGFIDIRSGLTYDNFDTISEIISKALQRLEKNGKGIKSGDSVAVKVNVPIPAGPETAACTHPIIAESLAVQLKKKGADVIFYEDCFRDDALDISGMRTAVEKAGVQIVNLNSHECVEVPVGNTVYKYYREIYESDHVISLPKMKTHLLTNFTGSIKNMFGCIHKRQRKELHKTTNIDKFSAILVDVFSIKLPSLVIMDGILGMEGAGPTHGNPVNSGILIVCDDGVVADYYTSLIMGYAPLQIITNKIALDLNLNRYPLDKVDSIGENYNDITVEYKILPLLSGKMRERFIRLSRGSIKVKEDLCNGCGVCRESCPVGAIQIGSFPEIDLKKCILCYCCTELCPQGAMLSQNNFKT